MISGEAFGRARSSPRFASVDSAVLAQSDDWSCESALKKLEPSILGRLVGQDVSNRGSRPERGFDNPRSWLRCRSASDDPWPSSMVHHNCRRAVLTFPARFPPNKPRSTEESILSHFKRERRAPRDISEKHIDFNRLGLLAERSASKGRSDPVGRLRSRWGVDRLSADHLGMNPPEAPCGHHVLARHQTGLERNPASKMKEREALQQDVLCSVRSLLFSPLVKVVGFHFLPVAKKPNFLPAGILTNLSFHPYAQRRKRLRVDHGHVSTSNGLYRRYKRIGAKTPEERDGETAFHFARIADRKLEFAHVRAAEPKLVF